MRHTIDEAAALVGRTRRSLYRAMTEGRLAYGLEADGRRYIDTAELLRVFGAFKASSQDVTPEMSHGVTVPDDLGEIIAKAVAKAVAEAVEPLRKEIELLRLGNAEQRQIEHKPDASATAPATPQPDQLSAASQPPVEERDGQSDHAPAVRSFADLLSSFE